MKKQPQDIITATLNDHECRGCETYGEFKHTCGENDIKDELTPVADLTGRPITEE